MEQYLTTDELSKRIKMPPGSIRNLVWKNELKLNVHYVKPPPGKSCLCGAPSKMALERQEIRHRQSGKKLH
jgi:hypothetical protein